MDKFFYCQVNPHDNIENLPDDYIEETLKQLPKRQRARFLLGEFGDDSEGALWTPDIIRYSDADEFIRIVIAVDPAVTSEEDSDETGIIVVGEDRDSGFHVLDDYSGKYTPREMAYTVVSAYRQWKADRVVGEVNNGGDYIENAVRNESKNIPFSSVRATRGKVIRAEPVVALYEQGRVKHIKELKELEDQMCTWAAKKGEKSPDRVDALVWGITYMMNDETEELLYA
jgi:predicted phage terminase large subunit-like protein